MTILRPPSRPSSSARGEHWFLWAIGGVVVVLVVLMVVVKSLLGMREGTPVEARGEPAREVVEIAPGLRYEVLIPAHEVGQKNGKEGKEGKKDDKGKPDTSKKTH